MVAAARMERPGVPVDTELLAAVTGSWDVIKDQLIAEVDADYGVFEGRVFKHARFAAYLAQQQIPWPRSDTRLDLDDDTFRAAAKAYPQIAPLRELRHALSELRLTKLAVGRDERNRTLLGALGAATGRNTPSSTGFIFGPSVWLRGLIRPPPGRAIAYVDWSQQEFGIAAALSGDAAMLEAYTSGDPYLAFAKRAGAVPPEGTKHTHGPQRELYKTCALAVQFGMEAASLAQRIGRPELEARHLLQDHREVFRTFWQWSDAAAARFQPGRATAHGLRLAAAQRQRPVRPDRTQFPHAGERRRDDASRRVPHDRGRYPGVCAGARRLPGAGGHCRH